MGAFGCLFQVRIVHRAALFRLTERERLHVAHILRVVRQQRPAFEPRHERRPDCPCLFFFLLPCLKRGDLIGTPGNKSDYAVTRLLLKSKARLDRHIDSPRLVRPEFPAGKRGKVGKRDGACRRPVIARQKLIRLRHLPPYRASVRSRLVGKRKDGINARRRVLAEQEHVFLAHFLRGIHGFFSRVRRAAHAP